MSLYTIYAFGLLVSLFFGAVWSFLDKNKPPSFREFFAKLIARALVLFVIIVIIVGFFALLFAGLPSQS